MAQERVNQEQAASKIDDGPVLIGDSHSGVVYHAARDSGFKLKWIWLGGDPQPPYNDDISEFHPDTEELLAGKGPFFSGIGQSMHDKFSLLQHPHPFDFVIPDNPSLPLDITAEIIPYNIVKDGLKYTMKRDFHVLDLLHAKTDGKMTHIISPPPIRDSNIVRDMFPWALSEEQTISSSSLRLKVYMVYVRIFTDWCKINNVNIIHPPSITLEKDGYINPEYMVNANHAKQNYGEIVLSQIQALL